VRRPDLGHTDQAGAPRPGPELLDHAAASPTGRPWFAIGGIENLARLDEVIARGARRVVVVRAITEADDPGAAAWAIAERLRQVADAPEVADRA